MILAYHFVADTLRDGRPIPPDGEWLVHDGPVEMCESGLHGSRQPFDALKYAPGDTLCLVEMAEPGEIVVDSDGIEHTGVLSEGPDKLVGNLRRIVKRIDATDVCRRFARQRALDVIRLWPAPDVARRYLETGDEFLRAAAADGAVYAAAARAAVRAAAAATARAAAARATARAAAARAASAYDAAAAAYSAADYAALAAGYAGDLGARDRYREKFNALVQEAFL